VLNLPNKASHTSWLEWHSPDSACMFAWLCMRMQRIWKDYLQFTGKNIRDGVTRNGTEEEEICYDTIIIHIMLALGSHERLRDFSRGAETFSIHVEILWIQNWSRKLNIKGMRSPNVPVLLILIFQSRIHCCFLLEGLSDPITLSGELLQHPA